LSDKQWFVQKTPSHFRPTKLYSDRRSMTSATESSLELDRKPIKAACKYTRGSLYVYVISVGGLQSKSGPWCRYICHGCSDEKNDASLKAKFDCTVSFKILSTYLFLRLDPLSNSRYRRSGAILKACDGFFDDFNGGHCRVFLPN
jgi:hypothetical protein